jgi:hypothetical protein
MPIDQMLDDGKAQTGAAQAARPGRVDAEKTFGQTRQMLARDAVAMVPDNDAD